jgi:hypothetical protein
VRTSIDALRSLKAFIAESLPADFDVRLAEEEGVFERPTALVTATTPQAVSGPRHTRDVAQSFTCHVYAEVARTAQGSLLAAAEVEELLLQATQTGRTGGRVPLRDYTGVGVDESAPAGSLEFLRIVPGSLSINRVRDPDDPLLYTVVMDLRLTWRRVGYTPADVGIGVRLRTVRPQ